MKDLADYIAIIVKHKHDLHAVVVFGGHNHGLQVEVWVVLERDQGNRLEWGIGWHVKIVLLKQVLQIDEVNSQNVYLSAADLMGEIYYE